MYRVQYVCIIVPVFISVPRIALDLIALGTQPLLNPGHIRHSVSVPRVEADQVSVRSGQVRCLDTCTSKLKHGRRQKEPAKQRYDVEMGRCLPWLSWGSLDDHDDPGEQPWSRGGEKRKEKREELPTTPI